MQNSSKGSLFSNRSTAPHSHRKQKRNNRRLISYLFEYLGDQLYYFGATIEREFKNSWRTIRRGVRLVLGAIGRGFAAVFRFIWRLIVSVFNDLINPFKKLGRSIKSLAIVMRDTRKQGFSARMRRLGQFFKYGWIWNRHLIFRMFNYLFPAAALAALVFVGYNMLNLNYALAVNYNGEQVGYVASEQVFDGAQRIIQSRMQEADEETYWTAAAELTMTVVEKDELASQTKMADNLLRVSGADISEGAGLYIENVFYGATTDTDALAAALDSVLDPYRSQVQDESTDVRFARNVELVEGVYPEKSIVPVEEIEEVIHSAEQDAVYHTVAEGETISDVAGAYGLTVQRLEELNPGAGAADLEEGETLLVAAAEPLLAVKVIAVETVVETVQMKEVTQINDNLPTSYDQVVVVGRAGSKEVKYEVEYENGEVISRIAVEETVLEEMVPEVRIKGGQRPTAIITPPALSGGQLQWPTGTFQFISRGWSLGHQAIDIAGQHGTAIYAADSGVVVTSVWSDVGYGYYIIIDHQNGMQTLYAHCSDLLVGEGAVVNRGDLIGLMGSTGNSTGSHLHFEVRIGGEKMVPENYLGLGGPLG